MKKQVWKVEFTLTDRPEGGEEFFTDAELKKMVRTNLDLEAGITISKVKVTKEL